VKKEEGWHMYTEINQLKKIGLKKSQIARKVGISRPTVDKYLEMTPDNFDIFITEMQSRKRKPDIYKDEILSWLIKFPDLSASQVYDWLEEKYNCIFFSEGTLRRCIRLLRCEYNITKSEKTRDYEAVEELPIGKQMQVDFGMIWEKTNNGANIRLYTMCFVLSNSRYKFSEWQCRPFTTSDIITIQENAFEYYSGIPEEIVYDQDNLILVSENHGDLIYTHKFAEYHKKRDFRIYMCKKADPESKGKIENVVGYVKNNFAKHRTFYNIDKWNEDCIKWLERRGNGKIHGTTKKIPAEVFLEEKKYLRPILDKIKSKSTPLSLTYQVRKDNTVPIKGNRYTVPIGTYKGPNTYVRVNFTDNNELIILELETDKNLGQYPIPVDKGNLYKNTNHKRDKSEKVSSLISNAALEFPEPIKARSFLENIHKEKPRYTRDQVVSIRKAIKGVSLESIDKALDFCIKNNLFSAMDFNDAVNHYHKDKKAFTEDTSVIMAPLSADNIEKFKIKPKVRDISEYQKIIGGK